ncbi:hypothetical protein [Segetibacter sp.]|uniref:hypothetical protein n=1 Tax=Segetibacter sp. TaxID=2231182 RepID=UPI0026126969|nr:hypothetical protein [Segetibacter sp.]MCW3079264.1 hypothetical protein [Segetibacter sp.]
MNEEQNAAEEALGAKNDTSRIFAGDGVLQSKQEFENDKTNEKDHYYDVDKPKKDGVTNIGDGEMRNEGLVGEGNLDEELPVIVEGANDQQD